MNEENARAAIKSSRLRLKGLQLFNYYGPCISFATVPILFPLFGPVDDVVFPIIIIFSILAVVAGFVQYNGLKLHQFALEVHKTEALAKLEDFAQERKWFVFKPTDNVIEMVTPMNFLNWGQRITVIFDENKVLVNSICDPSKKMALTSWGQNYSNVQKIRLLLTTS